MQLTIRKYDIQLEKAAFPDCLVLARHTTFPVFQIQDTFFCARWLGIESERMIAPPLFPAASRQQALFFFFLQTDSGRPQPTVLLEVGFDTKP